MTTKKPKLTVQQILLGEHLRELGIDFRGEIGKDFEFQFLYNRKFRFDLHFTMPHQEYGIELDGYHEGRHGAGWGHDNEKDRLAQVHGYRVLHFTNREVETGYAKEWITEWVL